MRVSFKLAVSSEMEWSNSKKGPIFLRAQQTATWRSNKPFSLLIGVLVCILVFVAVFLGGFLMGLAWLRVAVCVVAEELWCLLRFFFYTPLI